jgi:hypothetical protein
MLKFVCVCVSLYLIQIHILHTSPPLSGRDCRVYMGPKFISLPFRPFPSFWGLLIWSCVFLSNPHFLTNL